MERGISVIIILIGEADLSKERRRKSSLISQTVGFHLNSLFNGLHGIDIPIGPVELNLMLFLLVFSGHPVTLGTVLLRNITVAKFSIKAK